MLDAIEFLMTNPEAEEECLADKPIVEDRAATRRSVKSSKEGKSGALSKKELRKLAKKPSAPAAAKKEDMRDSGFIVV